MPLATPIKKFNTIGPIEIAAVENAMKFPLSGYLAGERRGGFWVQTLEENWAGRMGVKHAVACNSATSGLLAATAAARRIDFTKKIFIPCFTMSATAAPAYLTGAQCSIVFMDCDSETYCSTPVHCWPEDEIALIIVTNLFGQAAPLTQWRALANRTNTILIEDAAQAPFARTPDSKLAGTVGDMGVFSFNVHKHLQAGEGGIVVTNSDDHAEALRGFINHGECRSQTLPGLNLRMTEITAAIANVQLSKYREIISSRIELAHELSEMVQDFWAPPVEEGEHVFYHWAIRVPDRDMVIDYLTKEGVPVRRGYVDPLYRLPAFSNWSGRCPVAEKAHDKELMIFEICSWDPTRQQLREMKEIFKRASDL